MRKISLPKVPPQLPANLAKWNRLIFVGEAGGQNEAKAGMPFVGAAGKLLDNLMANADISRIYSHVTNVFCYTPPNNNLGYFFQTGKPESSTLALKPEFRNELARLYNELHKLNPAVIIALGRAAVWALLSREIDAALTPIVGNLFIKPSGHLVMPLFHPAYLLKQSRDNLVFEQTVINLRLAANLAQRLTGDSTNAARTHTTNPSPTTRTVAGVARRKSRAIAGGFSRSVVSNLRRRA